MYQSLHALKDYLQQQRTATAQELGHRPIGVAACEVFDDLVHRIRVVTDKVPAHAPPTRSAIVDHGDDAMAAMTWVPRVMKDLASLVGEGAEIVPVASRQDAREL